VKFRILLSIILLLNLCAFLAASCYAETLSSNYLIKNAKSLDGKDIAYRGEAVTAIMKRGDHSWINVNDGENAIGIWCKTSDLAAVRFVGGYKNIGDTLEIKGEFHRACPSHGGELDIHASSVKVVKSGYEVKESVDKKTLRTSMGMVLLTLLVVVIFRKRT
jgi:hypothetical protein